jgi:toxin YoeB
MRNFAFTPRAFSEFNEWSQLDPEIHKKIVRLLEDITRQPFTGLGKPEPLKGKLRGKWSRRITQTDRLVYEATNEEVVIFSCKDHY